MKGIQDAEDLTLQVVVTGMHLSPEFGLTFKQIEEDGFNIDSKIEMLLSSDTSNGIIKSMSLGMIGFGDAYEQLKPDIVLMLGDRFELLAAATAALISALPIAHIHGGESTEGAFDEAIRHSISKMSHLHFTAAEQYRRRVIQLGENPDRVFNVGAPGIEHIERLNLFDKNELEKEIGLEFGVRSLAVTWHPVTFETEKTREQLIELLNVLNSIDDVKLVFTKANADTSGRIVNQMIDAYVTSHPDNSVLWTSLGQRKYLSVLKHVDGIVGNSSSGIIEAPSLKTGTINIGDRQRGRIRAASVIDCEPSASSIKLALERLFTPAFQEVLDGVKNPHGSGDVSGKIVNQLQRYSLDNIAKKSFFDLPFVEPAE